MSSKQFDIVINHRVGTTQGHGGRYNCYDGVPLSWDERAITSCSGGLGNQSTGDNFHGIPNIDHTQTFVRKDIIQWLSWLRNNVGFQDFPQYTFLDVQLSYAPKYVKEYIEGVKPIFYVGEYWDSSNQIMLPSKNIQHSGVVTPGSCKKSWHSYATWCK
ncbi:hypothetical protein IFM89_019404 [Coptis chinensis]|uniref:1,4-alpha-D-glucan glucanohydrolase n=1 Tax=Coptis chinensis TaxID=261450 RepID=A0A835IQZ4_9MAGN|nr:hypothetical protein IFM89_019404 [Coptis chinensis]